MAGRKSLSKRTRFEIFKRDGYRCRYCGVTPAVSILRVDHVIPVVNGGTDDAENLVTSCEPCNAGKGPVPLDDRRLPDTMEAEDVRERAEQLREYTAAQREVIDAKAEVFDSVDAQWRRHLGSDPPRSLRAQLGAAVSSFSLEELDEAIQTVARHRELGVAANDEDDRVHGDLNISRSRYFLGILRNWREKGRDPAQPVPTHPAATAGTPPSNGDPTDRVKWSLFNIAIASTNTPDRAFRLLIVMSGLAHSGVVRLELPENWPWADDSEGISHGVWSLRFLVKRAYRDAYANDEAQVAGGGNATRSWWDALEEDFQTLQREDLIRVTRDGQLLRISLPADATGASVLKGDPFDPSTQWMMFEKDSP